MNDIPIQIIVAAFKEETAADEALQTLKEAKKERLIGIQDAAILRRDEKNQLHIKETADLGGGKGATIGGVLGGVIGLIGGPAGVVLGGAAGAAVGGLAAKLFDAGISDDRLEEIGKGLKPGTSAIIAIIEHKWVAEIEEQLALAGADVLTEALRDDIAEQLAKGKDVMYSALGTQEGVSAASIVTESGAESGNQETQPNQQADTQ